jgi:hypothetical protein
LHLVGIEGRRLAFGAIKLLRFGLPSRIHGQNAFLGQPGKEHPDRGNMLLNGCRRARVLFDVYRHRDWFNILKAAEAGALAPTQELADGMVISDPRVLVADGNGKKFEVSISLASLRMETSREEHSRLLLSVPELRQ